MTPHQRSILVGAWAELSLATEDPAHPWRLAGLATVGLDGAPRARTVVIRAVDPEHRLLLFHTDARSPKAGEIGRDPRASLLLYDPGRRTQLRGRGLATLHRDDDRADRLWSLANDPQRRAYRRPEPPGTPIDAAGDSLPEPEGPDAWARARERFLAVALEVDEWDWLELGEIKHRRARFAWDRADGAWRAEWIAP